MCYKEWRGVKGTVDADYNTAIVLKLKSKFVKDQNTTPTMYYVPKRNILQKVCKA